MINKIICIFVSFWILCWPLESLASDYPKHPITILVPSKAGGSTDKTARLFAEIAHKRHPKYNFLVKNVRGSAGKHGFKELARAEPDGYTIGLVFTPQIVSHVAAKRANYRLESFRFVGNISHDPSILVVHSSSPLKNLAEFTALARSRPLTVAVNGVGSDDFLAAKYYEEVEDVYFNILPTNGSAEQKTAVLGLHVDAAFMNLSQMIGRHKRGEVRIIALFSETRANDLDVPTSHEQGVDVEMNALRGMAVPVSVSDEIFEKIDQLFRDVTSSEEFKEKAAEQSIELHILDGEEFTRYLYRLYERIESFFQRKPW